MNHRSLFLLSAALALGGNGILAFAPSLGGRTSTTPLRAQTNSEAGERRPWDAFRFVRQSSKFVSLPGFPPSSSGASTAQPGSVLWSASENSPFSFAPLDDVVMGGASSSRFVAEDSTWKGRVTDANNGGFVGLRSTPGDLQLDCGACRGLEFTLDGFGTMKRLKIVVRDSTEFNGVGWTTTVNLKGGKTKIRVPFAKQVPCIFAKTVPNAPPFQSDRIAAIQLTYSKFEYDGALNPTFSVGDIELKLYEIKAY